jgi:tetratricopeptide (TPR) repeat protein
MNHNRKLDASFNDNTATETCGFRAAYFACGLVAATYFISAYGLESIAGTFFLASLLLSFLLTAVAAANLGSQGRLLANDMELRGTTRSMLKLTTMAITAPSLFLGLWHLIAIASYDGSDAAQSRIFSVQSVERPLFGRSSIDSELDALCQWPPFSRLNAGISARAKVAAGEAALERRELYRAKRLFDEAHANLNSFNTCNSLAARIWCDLAMYYAERSPNMLFAQEAFERSIECLNGSNYITHDLSLLGKIELERGQYFVNTSRFVEAATPLDEAETWLMQFKHNDRHTLSRLYCARAKVEQNANRKESAVDLYSQAAELQRQTLNSDHPDVSGLVSTLFALKSVDQQVYIDPTIFNFHALESAHKAGDECVLRREDLDVLIGRLCNDALAGKLSLSAEEELDLVLAVNQFSDAYCGQLAHRALFLAERDETLKKTKPAIYADILCLDAGYQSSEQAKQEEYERALKVCEDNFGCDDPAVGDKLYVMAKDLCSQCPYDKPMPAPIREKTERMFDRAVAIDERSIDRDCPDLQAVLNRLGNAAEPSERAAGESGEQRLERLMEKYETYAKRLGGSGSRYFAQQLIFLAVKYDIHHLYAKAQTRFDRAFEILNAYGDDYDLRIAKFYYAKHLAYCSKLAEPGGWEPALIEPYRVWP